MLMDYRNYAGKSSLLIAGNKELHRRHDNRWNDAPLRVSLLGPIVAAAGQSHRPEQPQCASVISTCSLDHLCCPRCGVFADVVVLAIDVNAYPFTPLFSGCAWTGNAVQVQLAEVANSLAVATPGASAPIAVAAPSLDYGGNSYDATELGFALLAQVWPRSFVLLRAACAAEPLRANGRTRAAWRS